MNILVWASFVIYLSNNIVGIGLFGAASGALLLMLASGIGNVAIPERKNFAIHICKVTYGRMAIVKE